MSLLLENQSSVLRLTGTTVKRLASTVLLGAGLIAGTAANANEITDQRGYERCVGAFDTAGLSGVTFPRVYYISHNADSKTYYVNAKAWDKGVRVGKRLTCETSTSGRQLLSVAADNGSYALAPSKGLIVAER